MNLYFAYGAHLSYFRLLQLAPTATVLSVACLPGFNISFQMRGSDGTGKCTVGEQGLPTDAVFGVVYLLGISERETLDAVVCLGSGYESVSVSVLTPAGPLEAFTYVSRPERIDLAAVPSRAYRDAVLAGAREHRLPNYYIETLQGFEVGDESDALAGHSFGSVPAT